MPGYRDRNPKSASLRDVTIPTMAILALFGLVLEAGGFGYAAFILWREWQKAARPHEFFEPQWLRRILRRTVGVEVRAVAAHATASASASAYVVPQLGDGSVEQRLEQLELWVVQMLKTNGEARAQLDEKDRALEQQIKSNDEASGQRFDRVEEQLRAESVIDLRRTGWGLIAAALGLLLQVPLAVAALF
jgi:hypothetical protein